MLAPNPDNLNVTLESTEWKKRACSPVCVNKHTHTVLPTFQSWVASQMVIYMVLLSPIRKRLALPIHFSG